MKNTENETESMDKINVALYGGKGIFGGREIPLRAEIIYCDKHDECTLYKNNKCLNCTAPLSHSCSFGKRKIIRGYTSRAKKYYEFRKRYEKDALYSKLHYPNDCKIALMGDYVFIDVAYAKIKRNEDGNYQIETGALFNSGDSWVERNKFTIELLYQICTCSPRTFFGNTAIKSYASEEIPDMLFQLKKILPKFYKEFILAHPEFDYTPNYIGKKAYIKTLVKGCALAENDHKFIFDGEYLTCEKYKRGFMPFEAPAYIKIKVTDTMTYEITDNQQVNENTIFEQ